MFKEDDFEDIRPYNDDEINPALKRIISEPLFEKILDFLFSDQDKDVIRHKLAETYTAADFQRNFMHPLVYSVIEKTSDGLTSDGFEQLTPGTPYLFVGNHRDIVLDSAILQVLLVDHNHTTSEITFGSNLMINQFIIDLGKVNRMFKVIRGGNKMELMRNSQRLSAYIRHTIKNNKTSAWIAQRSGRTKDGNDKTEPGLLKMFNMSGDKSFHDSFAELNIVPLVISYEYEPCCALKIKELIASLDGTYQKTQDEDLKSIITGITQAKGKIHMSIGKPVNHFLKDINPADTVNNKISRLAELIDAEVYRHYKLWPSNYIACDMAFNSDEYSNQYTAKDKELFLQYMENEIRGIAGDRKMIEDLFLKTYANPLINISRLK
ncbi:MAG: acyltransferase [Bacteroidales bacterium]|nr:acyltransferase [Bacteroidales bacterium]MBN2762988.1 acyltransferase [Bacteroidales bacterium]